MNEPCFIDEVVYLHKINKSDIFHLMNFLPGGGGYASPASLDTNNLQSMGTDFQRIDTVKKQKLFYSFSQEELRTGLDAFFSIRCSPRADILIKASAIRNGYSISCFDFVNQRSSSSNAPYSEEKILFKSELEIAFELGRRNICPSAPSRLTALFLVEASDDGKFTLFSMYPNPKDAFLMKVGIIIKKCFIRVDSNWIDKYSKNQSPEFVNSYWRGQASCNPKWEHLLEGVVGLRENGEKVQLKEMLKDNIARLSAK